MGRDIQQGSLRRSWLREARVDCDLAGRFVDMCERHDQLLGVYQKSVRTFGMALDALQAAIAISPSDGQGIQEYVEQARAFSEQARINLEKHIRMHGCQDEDSTQP